MIDEVVYENNSTFFIENNLINRHSFRSLKNAFEGIKKFNFNQSQYCSGKVKTKAIKNFFLNNKV